MDGNEGMQSHHDRIYRVGAEASTSSAAEDHGRRQNMPHKNLQGNWPGVRMSQIQSFRSQWFQMSYAFKVLNLEVRGQVKDKCPGRQ